MITRNFNLYLNAGHSVPLVINANQAEEGEQWVFSLFQEDGTPYIPTDGSIVGIKSDGYLISNSGTVVDGKVVINETQQMTAAAGKAVFELRIDGLTHGTANFIVLVEEDPTNEGIVSDSDLSLIEEALSAVSPLPTGGTVGQVLTKTASGSTWSNAGTPTQEQVADAVSDWADEHITVTTGVVIDTSLAVAGAAADSKKVGDEITDLKSAVAQGMKESIKQALLQIAQKVAYIDEDGQDYYDALYSALYDAELISISATFTQSEVVLDVDSLDSLKQYLTVTANYNNGTSTPVSTYTLSGTLTAGTSTITVLYEGFTTTFNVTVTQTTDVTPSISNWVKSNYVTMTTDSENNTIALKTTTNKTYQGAYNPFTTESGYSYRMVADATVVDGCCKIGIQNSSNSLIKSTTTNSTTGSHSLSLDFDHDAAIASLRLFCTFSTNTGGETTYSNFTVYKYVTGA